MSLCLQVVPPEFLRSSNVPPLGRLGASDEQDDDRVALLAEVDPITRPERQTRFPDAGTDTLVIARVAQFKPEHTRLNSRSDGYVESTEPLAKWIPAVSR
jgi:hypothetical protein